MARDPKAEVELTAHSRNLGSKLREARAKFTKFGSELKKGIFGKDLIEKGFWGKGGAQMVGNLGSSAVGGLGGVLADQASAVMSYNEGLVRLQINGNGSAEQIKAMDQAIRRSSDATGISKAETIAAARQYVALTGDLDGATASIATWARVAQASGSSISDVASTAQALRDNLKISPEQMQAAFGSLITQGKQGAVEMSELRNQLAIVSPLMAEFGGGTGLKGVEDLGAAIQVVRKGFGGTEETITGVQSLMTALIKNAARFQKAGVHVMNVDPKTHHKSLKGFSEIIEAIGNSKLMNDPTKLEKAFGRVEAYRAFLQLKNNKDLFDQLAQAGSHGASVIDADFNTVTNSVGGKLSIAIEKAKNAIADAFTPERIEKFAHIVESLLPKLGKLADFAGKIGDAIGSVEGVGEDIRGALGAGQKTFDMADLNLVSSQGFQVGGDNSAEARWQRFHGAQSRIADVRAFNAAQDTIMGAEVGEKSSPASIKAAFAAKYSGREYGAGKIGEEQAGERYLRAAGVSDPIAVALESMKTITAAGQSAMVKSIADAIRDGLKDFKGAPIVKVNGATIHEAGRTSPSHARRPGG